MKRCGKKHGNPPRRCRRLANHSGRCATAPNQREIYDILRENRVQRRQA